MNAIEIVLTILVALALAARIAGGRFFDGLGDVRATADGMRCRFASWAFLLVAGFVAMLYRDFPVTGNVIGGVCVAISAGGLYWEFCLLMNYTKEVINK